MVGWFYRFQGADQGPVSEEDLKHIFDSGALTSDTPVWHEGMADWVEARKILALNVYTTPPFEYQGAHGNSLGAIPANLKFKKWVIPIVLLLISGAVIVRMSQSQGKVRHRTKLFTKNTSTDVGSALSSQQNPNINEAMRDAAKSQREKSSDQISETALNGNNGNLPQEQAALSPLQNAVATQEISSSIKGWLSDVSFEKWLSNVQAAIDTQRKSHDISPDYVVALDLIKNLMENPTGKLNEFPTPLVGDPAKVKTVLSYLKEKLKNISEPNEVVFGYCADRNVWVIHDNTGGCVFILSDLDPSSGQIMSEPQFFPFSREQTGRTKYYIKFKTTGSSRRIIMYGPDALNLPQLALQNELRIPAGFGPGSQEADRCGTAMSAIIIGYGGKDEIVH